jgi:hypothetical protein
MVMAMPPEVSDEEIIQAGEKLKARGAVNATRLWEACGQRGKPVRLLSVWGQHEALAEKEAAASSMELPLLPAAARHQADALKQELSQGIDRSLAAIYEGVPHAVTLRYEDEHAALDTARLENKLETQDALEALGNISEERAQLRSDVASLRVRLASVETARDYRLLQNLTLTKHSETAQQGRRDAEARIEAQNSDRIELENWGTAPYPRRPRCSARPRHGGELPIDRTRGEARAKPQRRRAPAGRTAASPSGPLWASGPVASQESRSSACRDREALPGR